MAQLYFRYGTMNSGKSIEILKVAYNYEEQGKPVVLLTSRLDNRDGVGYISVSYTHLDVYKRQDGPC